MHRRIGIVQRADTIVVWFWTEIALTRPLKNTVLAVHSPQKIPNSTIYAFYKTIQFSNLNAKKFPTIRKKISIFFRHFYQWEILFHPLTVFAWYNLVFLSSTMKKVESFTCHSSPCTENNTKSKTNRVLWLFYGKWLLESLTICLNTAVGKRNENTAVEIQIVAPIHVYRNCGGGSAQPSLVRAGTVWENALPMNCKMLSRSLYDNCSRQ